jgi:sugar phosphate isomerase/epimerase
MSTITHSRRMFLRSACAITGAIALTRLTNSYASALFPDMPGVVSWTYRDLFKNDVASTLDLIRSLGMTDIEFSNLFGKTPVQMKALLDERGMKCSSYGVSLGDAVDKTAEVGAIAKTLGAKYVRVAWLPGRQPFTMEWVEQTAKEFNQIGRVLREQFDLTFCYHNHGFEYVPHGDGTLYDVLMEKTDPRFVSIELDLLWAYFGGQDPVKVIEKYGSRVKLIHLKDLRKGVVGDLSGGTALENDVTLGTGQLDFPAILRAAKKVGVKHYYIEDESPNVATQVPASIRYLKSLVE